MGEVRTLILQALLGHGCSAVFPSCTFKSIEHSRPSANTVNTAITQDSGAMRGQPKKVEQMCRNQMMNMQNYDSVTGN